jgi:hypothetical protein
VWEDRNGKGMFSEAEYPQIFKEQARGNVGAGGHWLILDGLRRPVSLQSG